MRILAVRGRNLASLREFEVALDGEGPLAGAGLFAITGPTGAGKSTLLDAICLALYAATPRLYGGSRTHIGAADEAVEDRVGERDPRAILRRGTGEGMAEVDFEGVDGGRWRASWHVWRSRRRPEGRLQPPRVELVNLRTNRVVSTHRRTEASKQIQALVGLSFAEFKRSVLLAQGEFAAFLRAPEDDRAVLLEKMTGTAIYAELSREVYKRSRVASERMSKRLAELEASALLGPDERRSLEQERDERVARQPALDQRLADARGAVSWFREERQLAEEIAGAREHQREVVRSWAEAATRRRELQQVEQAEAIRAEVEHADRAARAVSSARKELQAASRDGAEGAERARQAAERLRTVRVELDAARARARALAPEVEEARAVDARVEVAAAQEGAARSRRVQLEANERTVRVAADAARARRRSADQALAAEEGWLAAHETARALAAAWPRWDERLTRFAAERERLAKAEAALPARLSQAESVGARAARASEALAEGKAAEGACAEALATAEAALARHQSEHPPDQVELGLAALAREFERIAEQRGLLERFRRARAELDAQRQAIRLAESALEEAVSAVEGADRRAAELERKVAQLRADLEVARAATELAARRPELLHVGEPCPLCGAMDHPAAASPGPGAALVERVKWLLSAAQKEQGEGRAARARHASAAEAYERRATEATNRARVATDELREVSRLWAELGGSALEQVEAAGGWLADEHRQRSERQAGLLAAAERERALTGSREVARVALGEAAKEVRRTTGVTATALTELQSARVEVERVQHLREAAEEQLTAEMEALTALLALDARWSGELVGDPGAFRLARAAQAREWDTHEEARATRREAQVSALRAEELTAAAAARAAADLAGARQEEAAATESLAALRGARGGMLGGRATAEVLARLQSDLEAAGARDEEARGASAAAESALAAASERHRSAGKRVSERHAEAELAEAKLEAGLEAAELELTLVRELLARGEPWLRAERQALSAMRAGRERAVAGLQLAEQRQREHSARPPKHAASPEAADDHRVAAEAAHDAAMRRLGAILELLERDDAALASQEALRAEIVALRGEADAWARLDTLIGSASGSKFRTFAQSLTLEALLVHANTSLRQLRPRYGLQRVPHHDMAIQVVDHDMGGEIRSVSSLSGGEGFLVALALALGLSGLSAHQVSIDSLFIDEGFGSLDAESLEVALSVLDQLQATGRQIGIISHVPELVERVGARVRVVPDRPGSSRVDAGV